MPQKPPIAKAPGSGDAPTASKPPQAPVSKYKAYKEHDEYDRFLHTARWLKFSRLMRDLNPICQHIVFGTRCQRVSKEVHHILDARTYPEKRLHPGNVVCLCPEHHPKTQGEAEDSNRTFAATRGPFQAVYEHARPAPLKKGEVRITANGVARVGT